MTSSPKRDAFQCHPPRSKWMAPIWTVILTVLKEDAPDQDHWLHTYGEDSRYTSKESCLDCSFLPCLLKGCRDCQSWRNPCVLAHSGNVHVRNWGPPNQSCEFPRRWLWPTRWKHNSQPPSRCVRVRCSSSTAITLCQRCIAPQSPRCNRHPRSPTSTSHQEWMLWHSSHGRCTCLASSPISG